MLDVGGCSDGSASSLGRSPFAKQRSFKCIGKASSKSSSSGAEGAKWDEVSYIYLSLIVINKILSCISKIQLCYCICKYIQYVWKDVKRGVTNLPIKYKTF